MHPCTVSSCTSLEPASSDEATELECTDFLWSDDSVPEEVNEHIQSNETGSDDDTGESMISSGL